MLKEITITVDVDMIQCSSCDNSALPEIGSIGTAHDGGYRCSSWSYPKGWISIIVRTGNSSTERLFCPGCAVGLPMKTIRQALFRGPL